MIRKEVALKKLDVPSIYVLKGTEIESFLSKCDPKTKDIAQKDINEGGKILQVYHPYILTSPEVNNIHFLTSCVSEVLRDYISSPSRFGDYWIISYPIIPEDPVIYIVLRKIIDTSNFTTLKKDT